MFVFELLALLALIIILCFLKWCDYVYPKLKDLDTIKGPRCLPLLGSVLNFLPPSQALWRLKELSQQYGATFKFVLPFVVMIYTCDLAFIKFVMTSNCTIDKSKMYAFLRTWLGDGLLVSKSHKWRMRRKLLTPAFHFKILEQCMRVFNKTNATLVQQLSKHLGTSGNTVNVNQFLTLAAMDNIIETAMGVSMNAQADEESEYVKATKFMNEMVYQHLINPMKYLTATDIFTLDHWRERKAMKILRNYTMGILGQKRNALHNNKLKEKDSSELQCNGIKKKEVFIDLLLEATVDSKPLSDEDIMEEVDTFLFEGHDTVSACLSFTLLCLSQHPDVQVKILDEQQSIFGDDMDRPVTIDDLKRMNYLEMVIKEGLRLYPSVPLLGREVTEDFQFENLFVRKGTTIIIPIYHLHRDPLLYPNPNDFIPERFLPQEHAMRNPFSFIPFSAGYRNCIGQKFAMLELKSTIGHICKHFILSSTSPPHECNIPSTAVLSSTNGVYIHMMPRNKTCNN